MEQDRFVIDKNIKFPQEIIRDRSKRVHFIGLGGIGMSGLARFLLELNFKVSGSDIKDGPSMFDVSSHGGTVFVGHAAGNIGNAALVVVSSAIKSDNPELIEARNRNLPIMHRSQLLEALMSGLGLEEGAKQISIGVSGTHGKTTTTGMVSLIYENSKLNPSIVVGGQLPYLKTNSKCGDGKYFIAELDESDGSIELYTPDISIITNLEPDHLDHYENGFDQILETFVRYVGKLKSDSKVIINADCAGDRELLKKLNHKGIILYSCDNSNEIYSKAAYRAEEIVLNGLDTRAKIYKNNELLGEVKLVVPGIHNISNALACIACALESGLSFEQATSSLVKFTGMRRRFQILKSVNDAQIIDDYAHHPTEVIATLKSAKNVIESRGRGRILAIFQPHRYSRLAGLWNDFLKSFEDADAVYVCDVYKAGERPIDGITSQRFQSELRIKNSKYVPGSMEEIAEAVYRDIQPNDLVLTIGAGDITKLGTILIEKLEQNRAVEV